MKADKSVEAFIGKVVDSLLMWELTAFLWNNPGITDNARGISGRLGRRREDIEPCLESLVKHGIMEKWGSASDPVYAFQPASRFSKAMEKFMELNNQKEGKLFIWSRLLKQGLR